MTRGIHGLRLEVPVYLSLLVDDAMGFFSGHPAVEPQLSYVDDCGDTSQNDVLQKQSIQSVCCLFVFLVHVPEFNEE